jgi:hypothetical protein
MEGAVRIATTTHMSHKARNQREAALKALKATILLRVMRAKKLKKSDGAPVPRSSCEERRCLHLLRITKSPMLNITHHA